MSAEKVSRINLERLHYLDESPWSAMIRSFIVYLCVIAGLYFAIDDPFKHSTPAQYTRLAGTISVLALVVGYDPTRLRGWLGIIPTPQSQKLVVTEENKGNLKVEATQGPAAALTFADTSTPEEGPPETDRRNGRPRSRKKALLRKPR